MCLFVLGMLAGCASSHHSEVRASEPIPPTSKFAKISIGMPMTKVQALIGQPTDTKQWRTGKEFIPFYGFGRDIARTEALYAGEGRITYTGRSTFKVFRIEYDPTESGQSK